MPKKQSSSTPPAAKKRRRLRAPRVLIEPAVLTVEEASEYICVSRQTAYNMANEGRLPVVRPVPGTIRIVKSELDEMLRNGTLGDILADPWKDD